MTIVHHLDHSRSTRILWFLEEIGKPYEIIRHTRLPGFRAPETLRAIHPSGKAPLLVDGDLTIAESSVILGYLDARYGEGRFAPRVIQARLAHDEWMAYAESGAVQPLMVRLYASLTEGLSGVFGKIIDRDTTATLGRINQSITGTYLLGDDLMLADIQLSFVLELADYLNLLESFPEAHAYLDRMRRRPAFQRAISLGGPMMPA